MAIRGPSQPKNKTTTKSIRPGKRQKCINIEFKIKMLWFQIACVLSLFILICFYLALDVFK